MRAYNNILLIMTILVIYFAPKISIETTKTMSLLIFILLCCDGFTNRVFCKLTSKKQDMFIDYLAIRVSDLEDQSRKNLNVIFNLTTEVNSLKNSNYEQSKEYEKDVEFHKKMIKSIYEDQADNLKTYKEEIKELNNKIFL
jgi:hypothetical protein